MQPDSGPGQTGMNMETYLARMFNHGATLVNLYSWGLGGESNKNMGFRVVTEGPEALQAYRKFLKAETLVESMSEGETLQERLPTKIHKIQDELPAWIQRTGNQSLVEPLMHKLDEALRAKDLDQAEGVADSILELISQRESN